MMDFIKNFFREGTVESSTRLNTTIIVINSSALAWYSVINAKQLDALILGMIGLALAAKVIQKTKE